MSTVATNLKDCGPFSSLHRENLTPDELRSWTTLVQQGAQFGSKSLVCRGAAGLQAATKIDDQFAELEFRIARSLWMQGDYDGAKQHFLRARDLDTLRFRADSRINDINRSVASSIPGAELVDAEALFSKESPNGIIGSDLVYEHVHMTPLGNYLLARAMFLQIANKLPSEVGHPITEADVPTQTECEQLLAFTGHDHARITIEMLQRLQKPPFTSQVNHSDQVLRLTLKAKGPVRALTKPLPNTNGQSERIPPIASCTTTTGFFFFEHNRDAAVQQLSLSRAWDGFPVFTPDGVPVE